MLGLRIDNGDNRRQDGNRQDSGKPSGIIYLRLIRKQGPSDDIQNKYNSDGLHDLTEYIYLMFRSLIANIKHCYNHTDEGSRH